MVNYAPAGSFSRTSASSLAVKVNLIESPLPTQPREPGLGRGTTRGKATRPARCKLHNEAQTQHQAEFFATENPPPGGVGVGPYKRSRLCTRQSARLRGPLSINIGLNTTSAGYRPPPAAVAGISNGNLARVSRRVITEMMDLFHGRRSRLPPPPRLPGQSRELLSN